MNVLICIPAYNEENTLKATLDEIKKELKKTNYKYQIQVVDDGSTDKTVKIAKKEGAILFSNGRNKGLIETFKKEMKEAIKTKADIFVHTDADGQYPAKYIPALIKEVENGHDLVLGSRFQGEIESMSLMKRLGNIAFAKVISQICKTKITDSTTGFRAFTKSVAEDINLTTNFTYTQEQLIKAARMGMKIKEIPIYARKTRESRLMKGPIDYAIKAWINLFRIHRDFNPLAFFGKIGVVFLAAGLILGLFILYNVIQYKTVGGIPRVILSSLLIMSGIQIILFGFLADMKK
jgi:glycosyltransferase involved in cell wall biosynthesis